MIKATARENTLPGNSLTVQMKGGIQNLKRVFQYFFSYGSLCFSFFLSSFQINRIQAATEWPEASLLKIWLARPPTIYYSDFFYFSGGLGMLRIRGF